MTSTTEQQAQQQLDELSSSFAAWRAGKKHGREKIPMELLNQARQLSGALNTAIVCKRLGISWEVMRRVEGNSTTPVATPAFAPKFDTKTLVFPRNQISPLLKTMT